MTFLRYLSTGIAIASTLAVACARAPETGSGMQPAAIREPAPASSTKPDPAAAARGRMVVYKSASCGCCGAWVDHVRAAGFVVDVRELDDVSPIKQRLGVPYGKGSCHTAEVEGYLIEGHVPAGDVKRLLAEKPDAKGLVLPGMPAGSPGMERPDGSAEPYTVELVRRDGSTVAYAAH